MKKICPQGQYWADIHRALLRYSREVACNPPSPPKPLILSGWAYSSDRDKEERWRETVAWAYSNGCGGFVDEISDDQFYWIGDASQRIRLEALLRKSPEDASLTYSFGHASAHRGEEVSARHYQEGYRDAVWRDSLSKSRGANGSLWFRDFTSRDLVL